MRSVERDVDSYINEVIKKYRSRYPEDQTNFNVEINISIIIVD